MPRSQGNSEIRLSHTGAISLLSNQDSIKDTCTSFEWVPGNVYRKTRGRPWLVVTGCSTGHQPGHFRTGSASSQGQMTTYWKFRKFGPIVRKLVQDVLSYDPG